MRMPHRRPKVLDSPYFEPEAAAGIALSSQLSKGRPRIVGEAGQCELRAIQDAITGVGGQPGLTCVLFVPTEVLRTEERRGGEEWVRRSKCRRSRLQYKNNTKKK